MPALTTVYSRDLHIGYYLPFVNYDPDIYPFGEH